MSHFQYHFLIFISAVTIFAIKKVKINFVIVIVNFWRENSYSFNLKRNIALSSSKMRLFWKMFKQTETGCFWRFACFSYRIKKSKKTLEKWMRSGWAFDNFRRVQIPFSVTIDFSLKPSKIEFSKMDEPALQVRNHSF